MGTRGLSDAVARIPLADIVVRFRDGIDFVAATRTFNAFGDDLDLCERPWYDVPGLRVGSATKEALERVFGWHLIRVPLERYDESTDEWGTWPDVYRWEELNDAQIPPSLAELIADIGMTQPGLDDHGQWHE